MKSIIVSAALIISAGVLAAPASAAGLIFIADSQNNRIRVVDAAAGIITTYAGNGTQGSSGDGGPATSAELHTPFGVAVDGAGDLFIADTQNNRIREVNATTRIITTVAGTGAPSYSGDGGPATSAGLNNPTGVAVDSAGDIFIADQRNNRIRKVTAGVITTFAGNGNVGNGGDGGPATSAQLYYPTGVTLDPSGNLYIADSDNQKVREVSGGTISTIIGTGSVGYSCGTGTSVGLHNPTGVTFYAGAVIVADYGNQCVRVVASGFDYANIGNGTASYGGDGQPYNNPGVELNYPTGVSTDPQGDLYIADFVNNRIRIVAGSFPPFDINTFAGNGVAGFSGDGGPATSAKLYNPSGVAVYAGTAP